MNASLTDTRATIGTADEFRRIFQLQQQHRPKMARTTARERIQRLKRLYKTILERHSDIEKAVWSDLHKSRTETVISETGIVLGEIRHTIKRLKSWMEPESVATPIFLFGSGSKVIRQPKGQCLIIGPWNYPFNLAFAPLVAAISAGNCVVMKPSEYAPESSRMIREIVEACFPPEEVAVFEGDAEVAKALLDLPFNHIFFTGSPMIGKLVMAAASKHLASVTLELGGKSPVIVDETANLDWAAASIAWLKAMNAGQTCIAPDYVMVHEKVRDQLLTKIAEKLRRFYGETSDQRGVSPDYSRLISSRHFDRLNGLYTEAAAKGARTAFGGASNASDRFFETTLITDVPEQSGLWEEEIFGPLLVFKTFSNVEEAVSVINRKPPSLAMYIFSNRSKTVDYIIENTQNGGVTVNDCGPHFYNLDLPFGGVNNSGIGRYHGHAGYLEFSNARSVLYQNKILPTSRLLLPPYGGRLARVILEGLLKWF